jgi:VIT1/CCC1 family predicted Fe2+/Mn2+ transporter
MEATRMSKSIVRPVATRLVLLLLSALVLVLSLAATAFAATPFGVQYANPSDPTDPINDPGAAATGVGHLLGGIQGVLPFTGGPLLYLALLGVVLLCCGSALLVWRAVGSRR